MDNVKQQVLEFLVQYKGASGSALLRKFGSLDPVLALVNEGLVTKHMWHWECGTELPDQYACFRAVTPTNSTNPKH